MNKILTDKNSADEVWFIYDGECPICASVSRAYKIKKALGNLHILDGRQEKNHPLIKEINALGLDLDKGMVIKFKNTHYHAAAALQVMALLGTNSSLFNRINSYIFRSKFLSKLCYPIFRVGRNLALCCKGVGQIKNLGSNSNSGESPL